mgnify:CR=1 FL=1
MRFIEITKDNAKHAANALGVALYIKTNGTHMSYYNSDCPLLNDKFDGEGACEDKCSLRHMARLGNRWAGVELCPVYRLSNIIAGGKGYCLSIREDILADQPCEDI